MALNTKNQSINHNLPLVEDGQDLVEVVAIVVW
jgi:hypothetical protein